MALSCSCDEYDGDHGEWTECPDEDLSTLKTSRRKRCCACHKLIDIDADVLRISRWRYPLSDVEADILGGDDQEVSLADRFLCLSCAGIYLSLSAGADEGGCGYCGISPENVLYELAEYWSLTGFKPRKLKKTKE